MRRSSIFLACLLCLNALHADDKDPVGAELVRLASENPEERDAAEAELMRLGAEHLDRLRGVLAATTDAEVKARLGRICAWVEADCGAAPLTKLWADRWFLVRQNKEIILWKRESAAPCDVAGRRGWLFTTRFGQPGKQPSATLETRAVHNDALEALTCDSFLPDSPAVHVRMTMDGERIDHQVMSGGDGEGPGPVEHLDLRTTPDRTPTFSHLLLHQVERASLNRVTSLSLELLPWGDPDSVLAWTQFGWAESGTASYALEFCGVETIEIAGKRVETRHYKGTTSEPGKTGDFWVNDSRGILRMQTGDIETEATDELSAMGYLSTEASVAQACASLADADGPARDRIEQALCDASTRTVATVKRAMGEATDADVKDRLARVLAWWDPEFHAAELESMWKEQWFEIRSDSQLEGWEVRRMSGVEVGSSSARHFSRERHMLEEYSGRYSGGEQDVPAWDDVERDDLVCGRGGFTPVGWEWLQTSRDSRKHARAVPDGRDIVLTYLEWTNELAMGDPVRVEGNGLEPATFDITTAHEIERASLCRRPSITITEVSLYDHAGVHDWLGAVTKSFRFEGTGTLTFQGNGFAVRHYREVGDDSAEEYWVNDRLGVMKAKVRWYQIVRGDELSATGGLASEDSVTKACGSLAAVGPADRDRIEQGLLEAGAGAKEPLKRALAAATDPDVIERLKRVLACMDPELNATELDSMWKEQWFRVNKGDERRGAEVWRMAAIEIEGSPARKFTREFRWMSEKWVGYDAFATATCRRDGFTPIEAEWHGQDVYGRMDSFKAAFGPKGMTVRYVQRQDSPSNPDDQPSPQWLGKGRIAVDLTTAHEIERASLRRQPVVMIREIQLSEIAQGYNFEPRTLSFVYAGEEATKFEGRDLTVRRYCQKDATPPEEYWIHDRLGVMKANIDELQYVRTDEFSATGAMPTEEAVTQAIASLAWSDGPTRDRIEDGLCHAGPRVSKQVTAALASTADAGLRILLERVLAWLDPKAHAAELEAMWKEEKFDAWFNEKRYASQVWRLSAVDVGGVPARKFTWEESQETGRHSTEWVICGPDGFAAMSGEMKHEFPDKKGRHLRVTFDSQGVTQTILSDLEEPVPEKPTRLAWDRRGPATLDITTGHEIERASLLRRSFLTIQKTTLWNIFCERESVMAWPTTFRFLQEETLVFQGKELTVRHYREDSAESPDEYWVHDGLGVMKMDNGRIVLLRSEEKNGGEPGKK